METISKCKNIEAKLGEQLLGKLGHPCIDFLWQYSNHLHGSESVSSKTFLKADAAGQIANYSVNEFLIDGLRFIALRGRT